MMKVRMSIRQQIFSSHRHGINAIRKKKSMLKLILHGKAHRENVDYFAFMTSGRFKLIFRIKNFLLASLCRETISMTT